MTTSPLFGPSASPETFAPDRLIVGDYPRVTDSVTLAQSATAYVRGAVLGIVTASGKYVLSASAAGDGSQTPVAILADNVDATAGDVSGAPIYLSGEFNANALTLGTGWTATTVKAALKSANIYVKTGAIAGDIV